MKLFKNYILTFLLSVGFTNLQAQFIFQKALGTSETDSPRELLITNDGNYLVMGNSWGDLDSMGLYLVKLDTTGNKLWENWYFSNGLTGSNGVSCGEQSTVSIENVTINVAVLGVASKDKSKVTVNNITLTDCQTGFAAFQKKPEYGPATITATGVKSERVVLLKDEEIGSVIIINLNSINNI